MKSKSFLAAIIACIFFLMPFVTWVMLIARGARFALRDRLRKNASCDHMPNDGMSRFMKSAQGMMPMLPRCVWC